MANWFLNHHPGRILPINWIIQFTVSYEWRASIDWLKLIWINRQQLVTFSNGPPIHILTRTGTELPGTYETGYVVLGRADGSLSTSPFGYCRTCSTSFPFTFTLYTPSASKLWEAEKVYRNSKRNRFKAEVARQDQTRMLIRHGKRARQAVITPINL